MEVQLDQGVHRCIRFSRPDSNVHSFSLVTAPGVLLIYGDMGEFVFERTYDMFQFFRAPVTDPNYINPSYWHEKMCAGRKDGREFSAELARAVVVEAVADWPEEIREAAIDLISGSAESVEQFIQLGCEYRDSHEGIDYGFDAWWETAGSVTDYTYHFIWCLRAIVWTEWIWDKVNGTNFANANRHPLKTHEQVLVFSRQASNYYPIKVPGKPNHKQGNSTSKHSDLMLINKRSADDLSGMKFPKSIVTYPRHSSQCKFHPTEKPVDMIAYFIQTYSLPGELVLDPTMGSGSTGVACAATGREFVGIEKDPEYFEVARKRLGGL